MSSWGAGEPQGGDNMGNRTEALLQELREALQQPDGALQQLLEAYAPQDLAEALSLMETPQEQALALMQMDERVASEVIEYLDPSLVDEIFEHIPIEKAARLLQLIPADDAAQIIDELDEAKAEALLQQMAPPEAREVRELLEYPENTAGRLMVRQYVRVRPDWTVEMTLDYLRQVGSEIETIYYLYVVDNRQRLVGVCSLRDVVISDPSKRIEQIMESEPIVVQPDTDQEEVANLLSKYDLLAVPVVDELGRMLGIVTVDDVVDILVSESTEDVLKLGGVEATEEPYMRQSPWDLVRKRVRWLILLFLAERLTGTVLRHYDEEIQQMSALAWFIPLLIGTGGNAGAQTTTTITRALALGEVRLNQVLKVMGREMVTGLILGLLIGVVGVVNAYIWTPQKEAQVRMELALTVGLSQMAIIAMATTIGAALPLLAKRLNIDPAVMSAPFITTLIDAAGLMIYFIIAKLILFG
ncbi:MAG: magnesium transporter [Armatimonadetes bacterium JP3_11]|nr:MAG: magnesium transporter [Armatimonadetes bacterium JP3_11]RMH09573.1 MAG: magnesium transporter [Armatimonadota bacterium]